MIISPQMTLADALEHLDNAGTGALIICTEGRKLFGLLTDGDIRRALMSSMPLETLCGQLANRNPIVANAPLSRRDALRIMTDRDIEHLPVVDEAGILQDIYLHKILIAEKEFKAEAVARLDRFIIHPGLSIAGAIAKLDQAGTGALAVCTQDHKLEGFISDGDIRRAILKGVSMDTPCGSIAVRNPLKISHPFSNDEALQLMLSKDISQLPVVDEDGRLLDFLLRRDLSREGSLNLSAVIMAGGFGKRLKPLTEQVPKPMLPVGGRPLLERIIENFCRAGIQDVHLTTHYLPENIIQHFGNGEKFGVRMEYAYEEHPMGTAGGLRLLPRPTQTLVVINGDILTGVFFEEMLNFHRQHQALMTVGVRKYELMVPFGVVECEGARITGLREKPSKTFFINAGIYLIDPEAYDLIPNGKYYDMTDLIDKLINSKEMVASFPIFEYWLDIGSHEDYQRAQEDILNGRI